jgi:hypothetical protein
VTVEGRDRRRHVSAVDARRTLEQTTETDEAVVPSPERQRLFARERAPDLEDTTPEPAAAHAGTETTTPLKPRRRGGKARAEEKQD